MEDDGLHPLVAFLIKRTESHPEEFGDSSSRWTRAIMAVNNYGSEADKAALDAKLRVVRLNAAYEWALDELFNGEERRKKKTEENRRNQKAFSQDVEIVSPQAATSILGKLWKE
jgi:hypothetical protein